ncbi:glycosyltransferase family 4 protein [Insolitispirillum peregrinum]|uniref:glycosyltransferase family 4 protein n=1 Tax=Insolitispirillum peregrinum TaxID=80876 RepID=UPI0036130680
MQVSTVVILTDSVRNTGGAAKVALSSAAGLVQAGLRVIFVGGDDGAVDPGLAASGADVVSLGQPSISNPAQRRKAFLTGLWNRDAAHRLRGVLAPLDPATTVVHLHSWSKSLSTSVIPVIRRGRFPLVLTLHDYFTVCPNGSFYDHRARHACHRTPLSAGCVLCNCDARHAVHKAWRVARQVIQRGPGQFPAAVDAFIAVSDFSQRILQPFLPADTPIHRVDNPVDCFQSPVASPAQGKGVLYIGRLSPEKGPGLLAAAAVEAGVQVTFAGAGEQQDELQARYPQHIFTGWLSFAEILPLIEQTRALILPSLWYETLGLTVLESAARGVPAVVADTCAASDVVVPGETGLFFTGGDQASLSAVLRCLSDDTLVARLGLGAYQRFWQAPPLLERHCAGLLHVYRTLVPRV